MNDANDDERRSEIRHDVPSGSSGPSAKLIAVIVLAVVILVFVIGNGDPVRISFGLFDWDTTLRWSLFIAVLVGVALDRLAIWALGRRRERKRNE